MRQSTTIAWILLSVRASPSTLQDITQQDTDSAYQAYEKDFWRRYKASSKEDSDA